jgi:hypothetical protein
VLWSRVVTGRSAFPQLKSAKRVADTIAILVASLSVLVPIHLEIDAVARLCFESHASLEMRSYPSGQDSFVHSVLGFLVS